MKKAELLEIKIQRKKEKLLQHTEKAKELRTEISILEKEKKAAEEAELLAYMREYNISPAAAKALINRLQPGEEREEES